MNENNPSSADGSEFDDTQYRNLVDNIDDYAIFMLDKNGSIRSWNKGAMHILGYAKDEVIGQHFSIFYSGEEILKDIPSAELALARDSGFFADEGWRWRKDGSRFWSSNVITSLFDQSEKLQGYTEITKDMTERKRLEERFRQVVESAPNAMVMINSKGCIEMVNLQTEKLFDYPRNELIGQQVEILVPERFRHGHPEKRSMFFGKPLSRPMGAGRDLYGRRKNGSEFPVEIGLNPMETDDGVMVLSSIVDISDRKQKEKKIEAALKEKDLLLGEIHHRVKNNLQIIHSLLNLQASQISDVTVKNMLMDSQNRIQSMALIHQTLYQSHDFASVDFSEFLDSLIPTLISSYGINENAISLKIIAGPVSIPINSAIPCGLLINELVTNALKHAFPDNNGGEIVVSISQVENDRILLVIADNGVGIPETLDINSVETLGLRLVSLLSQQLDGSLAINRRNPTSYSIEFPLVTT